MRTDEGQEGGHMDRWEHQIHPTLPPIGFLNSFCSASVLRFGTRFPCMSDAYSKEMRALVLEVGSELGCSDFIREGVYCMVSGPNFETIAEARMLLVLGCDSVGQNIEHT